jgi:formylglycine-generating enzyme required for sulfatase activity
MSCQTRFRLVVLSAVVVLAGFAVAGWTQDSNGKRYALLVGVREYDHAKLPPLKYTENDVEELARVLKQAGYHEVFLLTTTRGEKTAASKPTAANIRKKLKGLLDKVTRRDVVLIGLAGHGVQYTVKVDGKDRDESFFCPSDARLRDTNDLKELAKTMLSLRELFKELDDSGAGAKLLLVDACRNDASESRNIKLEALARPASGTAAMFSCKSGERAWESPKLGKGHGVFFYHVIEGLKGEAKDDDGTVTWDDLTRYVRRRVVRQVPLLIGGGARQTPHLMANVEGDPVLISLRGKQGNEITNSIGMKLVRIPKGKFTMGSPVAEEGREAQEHPHVVQITQPFWMGVYEVMQGEYARVMGENPSAFSPKGRAKDRVRGLDTGRFPVDSVSWRDARAFCGRLSALPAEKEAGRTYRLPTEAEWEYACRAGTSTPVYFGKSLSSFQANFWGDRPFAGAEKGPFLNRTCKVGSYKPNAFGLYDMLGNVFEWCADGYDEGYYRKSPRVDPRASDKEKLRCIRGGSYNYRGSGCRAAFRGRSSPTSRADDEGFRVVCILARGE